MSVGCCDTCRLAEALHLMKQLGTSVALTWDDDSNRWECSWVTGGRRYTAHDITAQRAVWRVKELVRMTLPSGTST